ncbi:MAG: hypothetical protein L6Q46_09415 [Flavobacterium sp.]|uniref:hypothetical protein n=1 Tax=Flavobacterium sp. TaxID=239 RepID=UPI0025BE24ED|nr:hypothetical protein [Flavobacterium sp.]MCK6608503.1 hypothetical protein [Flavobacterium sp.]
MKKIAVLFLFLILASCSDDGDDNVIQNPNRELTILKVDFLTHTFEGGNSFEFNNIAMTNSLPIEETYLTLGDYGNYTLKYTPTSEVIFDGPITWMGGSYDLPLDFDSSDYETTTLNPTIDLDEIEYFLPTADVLAGEGYTNFDYTSVWNSIKNLQVTNDCLNNNGKIGFVLYTPAIGLFQPEVAYWLVILYK